MSTRMSARARVRATVVPCVLLALTLLAVACSDDASSDASRRPSSRTTTSESPSSSTTAASTQRCLFQHDAADPYAFAPPVSMTLPSGVTATIVPGTPGTTSGGIALDSDGSLDPGKASAAAALLWGAATDDGPFSQLERAGRGDVVVLRQPSATGAETGECVQRWRVIRAFEPPAVPERKEPALLRLVGFDADPDHGRRVLLYVDAVPSEV